MSAENTPIISEYSLVDYLNAVQPFVYINTSNNNQVLPITPYYKTLYKYSSFDAYNDYITLELKTSKNDIQSDWCSFLTTSKIINNHSIFVFSFENKLQPLKDIHFVNYTKDVFDIFEISTVNKQETFLIPKFNSDGSFVDYYNNLDTQITCSIPINIDYTPEYISNLTRLIEKDKYLYLRQFGYHSIW